ncbi:M-phase inducer phosphatase 3-like [Centruroides vittatus]|uniref:M-phase inducer phosphatase 3-like n=1 Tax=Centruroides vittatus TaxID=120091 RepID=UPI00350F459B
MAGSEEKTRLALPLRLNNSTTLNSGCGMSPVTDLMFNLSGLSTDSSLVETPKRRISWSSLTPSCLSSVDSDQSFNESPQPDIPVSQNRFLKNVTSQNESTQIIRRVRTFPFHQNPLRDKENIPSCMLTENVSRKKSLNTSTNDSNNSLELNDSGYSTCPTNLEESKSNNSLLQRLTYESDTKFGNEIRESVSTSSPSVLSSPDSSQSTTVRSTLFANDDGDDFLDVFGIDKQIDSLSGFSVNITNLLTKPVIHSLSEETLLSDDDSNKQKNTEEKKLHPRIRRCLSLMSECDLKIAKTGLDSLYQWKKHSSSCDINDPQNSQINNSSTDTNNNTRNFIITETKPAFKRPDPPKDLFCPIQSKRRKSVPLVPLLNDTKLSVKKSPLQRCHSETEATIMKALQKSVQEPDLIGDFSKPFALPLIKGKHQDVKTITASTVIDLLKGKYKDIVDSFTVVDCRYPYEFEGGHIVNAKNIYTKEGIIDYFLSNKNKFNQDKKRNVIIFHCEFSSERGPNLYRFLRNMDRETNKDRYPQLHHPELYILHGGYKAFYESFKEYCEPQEYKPMLHKEHEQELRQFKAKSKSWNGDCKARLGIRPGLKF